MKKSTWSFALSLVCAVLAGVIGSVVLLRAANTETVVVATKTLYPYTPISTTDVRMVTVPRTAAISGLVTSLPEVVGKYLSFAVPNGDPLTSADVNPTAGSFSTFLTQYTERTGQTGMLLALPVQTPLESVVNPGERIALLVTSQTADGPVLTTLEPVPVLNVLEPANGASPTALLLLVSEQNYRVLAPAIVSNNVQIGLIPQNGSFTAPGSLSLATSAGPDTAVGSLGIHVTTSGPPRTRTQTSGAKGGGLG